MHVIVETPGYLRSAERIFSEAEREEIAAMIAANPDCGDVMPGTGGFRKVRVSRAGVGKSGGARIIYILRSDEFPVFLIAAYAKSHKVDLTQIERNQLAKRADEIFRQYRSKP